MADPAEQVSAQCGAWLAEAMELRETAAKEMPGARAVPEQVDAALTSIRGYLDRVEAIYIRALVLRSASRRLARDKADAASAAWDTESVRLRRTAVGDRFQSGRQHEADVNMTIFDKLRASRQAASVAELAEDTARQIEVMYRGLDSARYDLATRLRHMQRESER